MVKVWFTLISPLTAAPLYEMSKTHNYHICQTRKCKDYLMAVYHHASIYLARMLAAHLCETVCTETPVNSNYHTCRKLTLVLCSLLRMRLNYNLSSISFCIYCYTRKKMMAAISEQRLVNGCCPGFTGRKSRMVQSENELSICH